LKRSAEDAKAILDHCISVIAESPDDRPSPDDKDCEARLLAMIGALKNELEQESAIIASVLDRAVTSGYAEADLLPGVVFLEEVAASRASQEADKKLLELMSDFRTDAERKERAAAYQVDQLKKRNTALEEQTA
jgi:hypothetical protein